MQLCKLPTTSLQSTHLNSVGLTPAKLRGESHTTHHTITHITPHDITHHTTPYHTITHTTPQPNTAPSTGAQLTPAKLLGLLPVESSYQRLRRYNCQLQLLQLLKQSRSQPPHASTDTSHPTTWRGHSNPNSPLPSCLGLCPLNAATNASGVRLASCSCCSCSSSAGANSTAPAVSISLLAVDEILRIKGSNSSSNASRGCCCFVLCCCCCCC
jgi:hypothetical protein